MKLFGFLSKRKPKPRETKPSGGRQEAPKVRRAAPPPHPPSPPPPAVPPAPPPSKPRPAVAPVGASGETDLAPSRVELESLGYPSVEGSAEEVDHGALRELFTDIAAGQAAPVKSFIGELRAGTATGEWLQICRPVMANLFESAASLGLHEAMPPMGEFNSALDLAAEGRDGKDEPIGGAARDVLLEAYDALTKALPGVFAVGEAPSRRETMLLHALLKQVQGVGIVTFDALYGVGITSAEAISRAEPGDLSSTTGIPVLQCEAICAALREHQQELDRSAHLPPERRLSERAAHLLHTLARLHETFLRVSEEGGADDVRAERKRAARRDRELCALKIEAALIEMGAVDCADALRVLSFDRRIEHLEKFLGVRVEKRAAGRR